MTKTIRLPGCVYKIQINSKELGTLSNNTDKPWNNYYYNNNSSNNNNEDKIVKSVV